MPEMFLTCQDLWLLVGVLRRPFTKFIYQKTNGMSRRDPRPERCSGAVLETTSSRFSYELKCLLVSI